MSGRGAWPSRAGFIMAAVGSAIGLGNVWRFPYICYQNGGGAFLIPYFFALLTCGIPLVIAEYGMARRSGGGGPQSFAMVSRFLTWAGWLACLCAFLIVVYYCAIMAWSWNYAWHSLTLAWKGQPEQFFNTVVLGKTATAGPLGGIQWPLLIGLVLTWAAILAILWRGIGAVAKVVAVTVPLPAICLVVLAIRGLTLPGAIDGVVYYLQPDFGKLLEPRVWLAAYGQILFSLSLGQAVLMAYASYLPKKADITNNAFMTSLANCGFSFFAGFAVFSALGFLALQLGVPVANVVKSGPSLAFITYPTVIAKLPFWAPFFGVVFFLMLLTLGIDSAFALVEGAATPLKDHFGLKHTKVVTWLCLIGLGGGIVFVTRGGWYWLDVVDHFLSDYGLVTVALAECIAVGWVFGAVRLKELHAEEGKEGEQIGLGMVIRGWLLSPSRFRHYVNSTSELKVGVWWDICVMYVTPLVLGYTLLTSLVKGILEPYGKYPAWVNWVGGWGLMLAAVAVALLLGWRYNRQRRS